MSGNKLMLDTNIVLSLLNSDTTLSEFLFNKDLYISFISELELLSYKKITIKEQKEIKSFLKELVVLNLNEGVKQNTIKLRKINGIKLPDAIIAASATWLNIPLITADKQLSNVKGVKIIHYSI
jgi:predicted nucleic acid-binding protein